MGDKLKTDAEILRALPEGSKVIIDEITWKKTDNYHRWSCHSVKGGRITYEGMWNCAAVALVIQKNPEKSVSFKGVHK